ncbi:MAG TPA: hypothetical protein VN851_04690 [Thermoanaerobaculia bacterium]|nr:hypothetical protein [Thermoanaerobaculia bacterium]
MFRRPWLLAGLLGLCALPSIAQAGSSVRLLSPVAGEKLEAGELAWIEWSDEPGHAASPETEWEAFLSLDGGRTYPIRLTPHLDLALRGFAFEVPNVPSRNARLLLRFGDEGTERIFEAPARFEIGASGTNRWVTELWEEPLARTLEAGEPARRGDRGVVVWLEGDREGRGLHPRVRVPLRSGLREARAGGGHFLFAVGPESAPPRLAPPVIAAIDRPIHQGAALPVDDPRAPLPLRLRIHRFNE